MKPYILLLTLSLFHFSINAQIAPSTLEEVILHTNSGDLAGTYHLPAVIKKDIPLVIIQAGSGPTDRNGNNPLGVKANSYSILADSLTDHGIAVLLTDKRGIAASQKAMEKEDDLVFNNYVEDLKSWIGLAQNDKRFKNIFLAGHSEGSLVAMLAALNTTAAGYISISGTGENIKKTITEQVTKQDKNLGHQLDSLLSRVAAGQEITEVPPVLLSLLRPSVLPYMRSWMQYDPAIEISKLKIPVLIIQGSNDLQVLVRNAGLLSKGAPAGKMVIVEGMNHVLKLAPADPAKNFATYADPTLPIPAEMIEAMVTFIKKKGS